MVQEGASMRRAWEGDMEQLRQAAAAAKEARAAAAAAVAQAGTVIVD